MNLKINMVVINVNLHTVIFISHLKTTVNLEENSELHHFFIKINIFSQCIIFSEYLKSYL